MHRALRTAAVVICCTGWSFTKSAQAFYPTGNRVALTNVQLLPAPAAQVATAVATAKAQAVPVDDVSPPTHSRPREEDEPADDHDGRDRRDGDSRESARHGRDREDRDVREERDDDDRRDRPDFESRLGRRGEEMNRPGRGESDGRDGERRGESGGRRDQRESREFMRPNRGMHHMMRRERHMPDGADARARMFELMPGFAGAVHDGQVGPHWQMNMRAGSDNAAEAPKGPTLGVQISNPDAVLRSQLGLPDGVGLVVDQVLPDTVAAKSGIKQYDVLQKIDDQLVINPEQVSVLLKMHKSGEKFTLTVLRQGKSTELSAMMATPTLPPATMHGMGPGRHGMGGMHGMFGMHGMGGMTRGMHHDHGAQPGGNPPPPPAAPKPPTPPVTPSPSDTQNSQGTSTQPKAHSAAPNQSAATEPSVFRQLADLFVD